MFKNFVNVSTVGELISYLKQFPEDMKLMQWTSNRMECVGYDNKVSLSVDSFISKEHHTYDAFDGGEYTYRSYSTCGQDEVGEEAILFY